MSSSKSVLVQETWQQRSWSRPRRLLPWNWILEWRPKWPSVSKELLHRSVWRWFLEMWWKLSFPTLTFALAIHLTRYAMPLLLFNSQTCCHCTNLERNRSPPLSLSSYWPPNLLLVFAFSCMSAPFYLVDAYFLFFSKNNTLAPLMAPYWLEFWHLGSNVNSLCVCLLSLVTSSTVDFLSTHKCGQRLITSWRSVRTTSSLHPW